MTSAHPDELLVDSRGQLCPLPIIELGKAFDTTRPGQRIRLLADDPAAAVDVAAWCRMRGQELVGSVPTEALPGGRSATAYVVRHL